MTQPAEPIYPAFSYKVMTFTPAGRVLTPKTVCGAEAVATLARWAREDAECAKRRGQIARIMQEAAR